MVYLQDYQQATDKAVFIKTAIDDWRANDIYNTALIAKEYDSGNNTTIKKYIKFITDTCGNKFPDPVAANNKIATSKFNELLTQSVQYSLSNGINYVEEIELEEVVGKQIDTAAQLALRLAMRDGASYTFYDGEQAVPFSITEFCPLFDENTGELAMGIRFYQIDSEKPMSVWVYEVDGVTLYRSKDKEGKLELVKEKTAYKLKIKGTQADGVTAIEGENYGKLPIVQLKGNMYGISYLKFVREQIDSYDLCLSGLANDLEQFEFVFWIVKNSGGLDDGDLAKFRQHLKNTGIAKVDSDDGGDVQQFQKEIPTEGRTVYLDRIMSEIYSSFGAVDMNRMANGSVNELQVLSYYTVADNKASEIEMELKKFVVQMLSFKGISLYDWQVYFIRNKLSSEQQTALNDQIKTNTVMMASTELSDEEILNTLKNHTTLFSEIDVNKIITAKGEESLMVTEFENPIEGEITE